MRTLGQLLLGVVSAAYPLLWYFGRDSGLFFVLAALMGVLWLIRAATAPTRSQRITALLLAAFFGAALLWQQPASMYWYPVAVNLLMLAVFGSSLMAEQTVIEKLARLQHPDLPPQGVRHTRRVTQIWCVFFIANGLIAALLALSGRHDWWALYTGVIAYILMGLLFAGEWLYRKCVLKV
ncbi:putative membrane protein [Neisseria sp. HSC-16F19]|nr:putative membrane protein [Neisseria sp. HSC-16F19]